MLLINGECADQLQVSDRGLHYGDGLFTTLEVQAGQPVFLAYHLGRLQTGCARLNISPINWRQLLIEVETLSQQHYQATGLSCAVVKIIITRGSGGRGYRPPDDCHATRIVSIHPFPDYPPHYWQDGVTVRFCATRLGLNQSLAGIKHLNRLEQVLARAEWSDSAIQEGLMLDNNGCVIEGTMTNLFFRKAQIVYTPKLTQAGVAGIMRMIVMELLMRNGIALLEIEVSQAKLLAADELFVTNSLIGLWPVKQLEQHCLSIGSLTRQLQTWLAQYKHDSLRLV